MRTTIMGDTNAAGLRFALIVARFNEGITEELLGGAISCLEAHGADESSFRVYRVPGAFEIPVTARRLLDQGGFDAIVALAALIRGETPHFDYISTQASLGISEVSIDSGVPIAFGVLTCDTLEQAEARVSKGRNKGWEAALAAIEMASLFRRIGEDG